MRFRHLSVVVLVLAAAGCGGGGQGGARPKAFTTRIDNPYLPMAPGSRWVYRSTQADGSTQRDVVEVTRRTKRIAGIDARVVHDVASEHGSPVEDTLDWYAQDARGNVWYLGEHTRELDHGKVVSTEGSWQAGVDGARPGIVMPARPRVGMTYRQEHYRGQAEDMARNLSRDEQVQVPFGHFKRVLMTKEWSPLEPDVDEHKLYARGVGPVLALTISGGWEREQLVRFRPGRF